MTQERLETLREKGGKHFLIHGDQREAYFKAMNAIARDPGAPIELKTKVIKESAFIHVDNLFTVKDLKPVIENVKDLVGDMVDFIHGNMAAAASLLTLSTHDYYTYNHSVDVAVYSIALMKEAGDGTKEEIMLAGFGGFLHDLGKKDIDASSHLFVQLERNRCT